MSKIAIVGSGLIGQSWATVFAQAGHTVALYDPVPDAAGRALDATAARLGDLVTAGLLDASEAEPAVQRLSVSTRLEDALDGAVYIQESGPEQLEVKRELTARLDAAAAPDVPIGSSTSGIAASRYCEHLPGRHRCLVAHPINPPHLIPAVEIVPTPWTDASVVSAVDALMTACDRETILLAREIDGFVVNRLQGALLQEAFKLIGDGVVSARDLDKAVAEGLGLRWSFMGPMQTIHLNAPGGVAQYVERYGDMYRGFKRAADDDVDWSETVANGLGSELEAATPVHAIPTAQRLRDQHLMALLRHKARADDNPDTA